MKIIKFKITIIIMGLCLYIALFLYIENIFPKQAEFNIIGKVISCREENEYTDKYIIKILNNLEYKNTESFKIIIYVKSESDFLPGDILRIQGIFEKADKNRNYKGFSYYQYLRQSNIFGIIKESTAVKIGEKNGFYTNIIKFRQSLSDKLFEIYNEKIAGFLDGLLLGKTDTLNEKISEDFKDSSISHILAISGSHIVYVVASVKLILDKILNNKKIKNYILIIFIILFYILTGSTVSCIRACIMASVSLIAQNIYRKNNFYRSLIFSIIIIIFINPYNVFNIGMWLSYAGTLGIVMFYGFFEKLKIHKMKTINSKFLTFIFENLFITVSSQILIFPIMIYNFNVTSLTFFIPNVLVSILINPIMGIGYINLIISYFSFTLAKIISYIETVLINIVMIIAKICAKLPFTKIYSITPSFLLIILYYLIIVAVFYLVKKRKLLVLKLIISRKQRKKYLIKIKNQYIRKIKEQYLNKIKLQKAKIIKILILVITIILIIQIIQINFKELEIYFIDVGQGDSCLLKTPEDKIILIDGGEGNTDKYDYGEKVLLPYLLDKKINKIDFLIISHADSDHIGGLFAILENLNVSKILIGVQPENSKQFEDLLKISQEKRIEIIYLKSGDKFEVQEKIEIDVLWPDEKRFISENKLNNNSLVFKINYNNFSILFTGDIEEIAEKEILNKYEINSEILKSTILKVSHHGSKTSTIQEFLEKVEPQIALIGVGKNNSFGHPSDKVIELLEKNKCKIYRTDLNGEIQIKVDKKRNMKIRTRF